MVAAAALNSRLRTQTQTQQAPGAPGGGACHIQERAQLALYQLRCPNGRLACTYQVTSCTRRTLNPCPPITTRASWPPPALTWPVEGRAWGEVGQTLHPAAAPLPAAAWTSVACGCARGPPPWRAPATPATTVRAVTAVTPPSPAQTPPPHPAPLPRPATRLCACGHNPAAPPPGRFPTQTRRCPHTPGCRLQAPRSHSHLHPHSHSHSPPHSHAHAVRWRLCWGG